MMKVIHSPETRKTYYSIACIGVQSEKISKFWIQHMENPTHDSHSVYKIFNTQHIQVPQVPGSFPKLLHTQTHLHTPNYSEHINVTIHCKHQQWVFIVNTDVLI